jgi:small subunit ribosomal protein S17
MPRRVMQGTIVSDKGDKTVVVQVERTYLHPLLKKTVRRSAKFHAHDEYNAFKTGQAVEIRECPPKSKLKRWEVVGRAGA